MTALNDPGRGWLGVRRGGLRGRNLGLLAAGLACLLDPGFLPAQRTREGLAGPGSCEGAEGRVTIEVDVRTTEDESVGRAEVWAESSCPELARDRSDAPPDGASVSRVAFLPAGPGHVASLPAAGRWRIRVRALGYLEADSVVETNRGGRQRVRIDLLPDPLVLPELAAVVVEGGNIGLTGRSVQRMHFAEAAVTYASVAEWLETLPGVTVRDRGPGGRQTIGVRGSRSEGVLVLLDGTPLNDPLTGSADLSLVPPSSLESAALVRGTGSARYGSGAEAGVLLLNSRFPGRRRGSLEVGLSSFGGRLASGSGAFGGDGLRLGGAIAVASGENDYEFRNRLEPGAPIERRENADHHSVSAVLGAAAGPIRTSLRYDGVERGVPGRMGTQVFDQARWSDAGWSGSVAAGSPGQRTSVHVRSRRLEYRAEPEVSPVVDEVLDLRWGAEMRVFDTSVSGRVSRESVSANENRESTGRTIVGGSAARTVIAGRMVFEPVLGVDATGSEVAVSPEVAMEFVATPAWRIWGRAGRGFRLPTFADLYPSSARRVVPNPNLRPETVVLDAEAGVGGGNPGKTSGWKGSLTGFYRETHDPIVWLASAAAVWSPRNLDRLRAWGVEAEAAFTTDEGGGTGWAIRFGAALTRSRLGFGDNRNPMPYQPDVNGSLSVERRGLTRSLRGDVRLTGSRSTSVAATRNLPAFTVFDLSGVQAITLGGVRMELVLRVENVFDEPYEFAELFPEPGRTVEVRVRTR